MSIGFLILLKADRRVHATVACMVTNTIVTIVATPILASRYGVLGAAWGIALGTATGSVSAIVFGLLPRDIPLRFWRDEDLATAEQ
jgi:O-antigen/teichoic acid export membrane protein